MNGDGLELVLAEDVVVAAWDGRTKSYEVVTAKANCLFGASDGSLRPVGVPAIGMGKSYPIQFAIQDMATMKFKGTFIRESQQHQWQQATLHSLVFPSPPSAEWKMQLVDPLVDTTQPMYELWCGSDGVAPEQCFRIVDEGMRPQRRVGIDLLVHTGA
jgi:hypothetical protein